MKGQKTHREDVACDAALSWIARLRSGPASERDTRDFALWLAEDSHRSAMDQMLEMWDDLGCVKNLPFPASYTQPAANQRNWLAASVAVAACLVLALFMWPQPAIDPVKLEFRTTMGERHSYQLEDQSTLTLNTNSKASVAYTAALRHIDLLRGEAYFEVHKDADRPFEVDVGNARVTALGTAFNIYRSGETATITVTEGVVRVTALGAAGRPTATEILRANQYLTATDDGLQPVISVDVTNQTAWTQGKLIAEEMPLPELVRQLERYWDRRILIVDPEIARLTFSGVFELDQPQAVLNALQLSLDLEVVEVNERTLQLLKSSQ
jgi:transmembrane sensor